MHLVILNQKKQVIVSTIQVRPFSGSIYGCCFQPDTEYILVSVIVRFVSPIVIKSIYCFAVNTSLPKLHLRFIVVAVPNPDAFRS